MHACHRPADLRARRRLGDCTQTGNTVTCTPGTTQTTRVGNGDPSDNITVNVQDNAQVNAGNDNAISLGDNANITLGANSTVSNNATSGNGQWNAGKNTIEFGSNGRLTIGTGARVTASGTQNNGEPINVMGTGNVITNRGTISSRSGAAIWFEDRTTGAGNTIDNYGIIETQLGAKRTSSATRRPATSPSSTAPARRCAAACRSRAATTR